MESGTKLISKLCRFDTISKVGNSMDVKCRPDENIISVSSSFGNIISVKSNQTSSLRFLYMINDAVLTMLQDFSN